MTPLFLVVGVSTVIGITIGKIVLVIAEILERKRDK